MGTLRIILFLVLAALLVPTAAANHWLVYYSGIDERAGATREDDGEVFNVPGSPFDGRVNRVVYPGNIAGDGSLFLDARVTSWIGRDRTDEGTEFYDAGVFATALGREDVLLPGIHHTAAWYGWWNDLDADSRIDDVHDASCGIGTPCPDDEFLWRGIASGSTVSIHQFSYPFGILGVRSAGPEHPSSQDFSDRTSPANGEQGWVGAFTTSVDANFLLSITTFVLAGAPTAVGSRIGYDLDDAGALYDVDRYASLSPDVEALWFTAWGVEEVPESVNTMLVPVVEDFSREFVNASTLAADTLAPFFDLVPRDPTPKTEPRDGKEPTTSRDDFEGRALFGGACDAPHADGTCVGDVWGSGNAYDGYADAYHLYFDNAARTGSCVGASASVAPGVGASAGPMCQRFAHSPQDALASDVRAAGTVLSFWGFVVLWHDLNEDTHISDVCDPADPLSFDAERNTCRPEKHPRPWPHKTSGPEFISVCSEAVGRGGAFKVTPIGGSWSGAVLVRDERELNGERIVSRATVLEGDAPVALRWKDDCVGPWLETRDNIVFPSGGSRVPLRVEAEVSLAGYRDLSRGIDVGFERVRDVDILAAPF